MDFCSWIDKLNENYTPLRPTGELGMILKRKKDKHSEKDELGEKDKLNETKDEHGEKNKLNDIGIAFIRGGVVAVVATWEAYVQALLKEAFDILIRFGSGPQQSLEALSKIWPQCRTIIQNQYKGKVDNKPADVRAYDLLLLEDQTKEKVWMKLLDTHCQNVLGKTIVPIFSKDSKSKSVDVLFRELFEDEEENCSLSELIVESDNFQFTIISPTCKIFLTKTDVKSSIAALYNLSRFYYGLRCALVHGSKEITLQGVLLAFPKHADEFELPDGPYIERAKNYYTSIYIWIKKYGRDIWLYYRDFVNITRFYKTAARCLMMAVAMRLYKITKKSFRCGVLFHHEYCMEVSTSDLNELQNYSMRIIIIIVNLCKNNNNEKHLESA